MGFRDTSLLCKIVLILLVLCFCIDLIGFAIPYWSLVVDVDGLTMSEGLWDSCIEMNGYKTYVKISNINLPEWFRAVRAFSILSWVFFLAALLYVTIFVFFKSDTKALYDAAVYLTFAGASWALIASAVYARKKECKEFQAGFALTSISFLLGLKIGILGMLDCLGFVGGK